ncbi:hypothetical protein CPB84DRAFT_1783777 [Gymnopilus junonius]|uniref:RING-type E3 ubiquitin transferase n=1 Tax=Gymnopilus junonius TaxID=109634 RepID=A0A9P5NM56_GYMJU|nr:hypothetical protein CPB84DRAFT_1783777 [Gymnopilus junonius]
MTDYSVAAFSGDEVDDLALAITESLTCRQPGSKLGKLDECPVCCESMHALGGTEAQEQHLKACLDTDLGLSQPEGSSEDEYIVYRLPEKSVLIGVECDICLEEFDKEADVARMACLCVFHRDCFLPWFERANSCPVHVVDVF